MVQTKSTEQPITEEYKEYKDFISDIKDNFNQKKGKRLIDKYLGPLSEIVDFEDPENQNLETFIIWKEINEEKQKAIALVELNKDLIPKNTKNYNKQ